MALTDQLAQSKNNALGSNVTTNTQNPALKLYDSTHPETKLYNLPSNLQKGTAEYNNFMNNNKDNGYKFVSNGTTIDPRYELGLNDGLGNDIVNGKIIRTPQNQTSFKSNSYSQPSYLGGRNMGIADQLNQAKNNALNPTKTIYASGQDLVNAQNTYGNTYNYQNLANNSNINLKQGDMVMGGSAVTPGIADDIIKNAGAQRIYGNDAAGTLSAMQNNAKSAIPQSYQDRNNSILSGSNYQNLALPDITSGYKDRLNDALSNSKYHDISYNTVGMDNTPYTNAINNALNGSTPTGYQNAVQNALKQYNGNVPSFQDLTNRLQTVKSTTDLNQLKNDIQKYYPEQASQFDDLLNQAKNGFRNGQQSEGNSMSELYNRMNNLASTVPTATYNPGNPTDQASFESKLNALNNGKTVNPIDSATFNKNMTDSINNLYDTQKNNVGLYYQPGLDQAKQQYAGLRDQASVANQQNLNKLKEAMSQQGLFNSGDNITAQTGINNQYANDLSGYNQQEQNYYNNVNNQIAQQKAQLDVAKAQALMDLGYKSDTRDFSLANLYDSRNKDSISNALAIDDRSFKLANLLNSQRQQQFQNAMTGINAQYGMNQDQFNNTLKGTGMTYGMGRDNVDDQRYNNDTAMKADQINYGRNQDYFNNTLKTIAQQYGMDQDQINNLLKFAQFNSSEDQRKYQNSTNTNNSNYGMYQDSVKNDQWQQQYNLNDRNSQWENSRWAQEFTEKNKQYQEQFDYKKQQDAIANQLAQARIAASGSRSGGRGGSSGSSGDYSNTDYKNSNQQSLHDYANNSSYTLAQKLQALSGYANSSGVDAKDAQYAKEQQQALLDGRWYEGRYK